ncbi:putative disease resistance protein [Vitis vinifera]|uniref:Putative disease resistance protein n=1 Tax=Vitis vinifera TaxID=29760 RepID=A0A438H7N8_VITVI|nr:putative disease resistance protein [Vitis vinifera]
MEGFVGLFQKYVGKDALNSDPEISELAEMVAKECCDEFDDTDGARNQGFNIISTLVHACLLEEPSDTRLVKFHDVVRDMALWITSEMGEMKGKFLVQTSAGLTQAPDFVKWTTTERISLMDNRIEKLTGSPTCPNLSTLLLDLNSDLQMISNGFFQFMPNLRVLSLSNTKIVELPSDISNLVSLQYLDLYGTEIKKLPIEMKNLVQLKILILCTSKLSSIPRGLISSLLMLQVIGMYNCGLYDQVAEGGVESYEIFKFQKVIELHSSNLPQGVQREGKETVGYSSLNPKVKCFHGLCEVVINRCQMLKNLTWLIFAPNLLYLKIGQCDEMEEVIECVPESLALSYLDRIEVVGCPKLKKLPLNSNSANQGRVVMVGKQEWWNELEWEDEATLTTFLPSFNAIGMCIRTRSLAVDSCEPLNLREFEDMDSSAAPHLEKDILREPSFFLLAFNQKRLLAKEKNNQLASKDPFFSFEAFM